ncbi:MAG: hypothetical protein WCT10_00635 [Patescibacteria group bacterium]|jgi:hypothetical protein
MSSSTSTLNISSIIPPDFFQKIQAEATAQATAILESTIESLKPTIWHLLPFVIGGLVLILVVALIKAAMGRWGTLGSLLYHLFYFGILGIILWIKGPGLLFSAYFDLIIAVLYPLCYWLTGLVLQEAGFTRRRSTFA